MYGLSSRTDESRRVHWLPPDALFCRWSASGTLSGFCTTLTVPVTVTVGTGFTAGTGFAVVAFGVGLGVGWALESTRSLPVVFHELAPN
jgi:hypothetical protein